MLSLVGLRIAVLGGDARSVYIVQEFAWLGAQVKVLGVSVSDPTANVQICSGVDEALTDLDVLVIPLPGVDNQGRLRTFTGEAPVISKAVLQSMGSDVPVFTVIAGSYLAGVAAQIGLQVIELAKCPEFAIYNAIPSAEGAIQLAMQTMPITIHGCRAVVLGFGSLGMTLARALDALGAKTAVASRNPVSLARAYEMGLETVSLEQLAGCLAQADLVFNTIPALVLDRGVLEAANPDACIIDLASAPGGTDFEAARALGLNASLAPNLPGKVAPKSAGRIIAHMVGRLLLAHSPQSTLAHEGVLANAAGGR